MSWAKIMMSSPCLQNILRPGVAKFAEIIKIVIMWIKATFQDKTKSQNS